MKIIGGNDYYDGAGYGVDETVIFLRKEEHIAQTPFILPEPTSRGSSRDHSLSFHYILVAGRVYPAVKEFHAGKLVMRRGRSAWTQDETVWHYDADAAMAAYEAIKKASNRPDFGYGLFRRLSDEITRHFRETESKVWTDWMLENRVVTGFVSWERYENRKKGTSADINIATLSEIDFYRAVDPATIHMEIANYVGGVLPSGPDTIEISDLDRVRKAGFDTKTSFRQDPGVKKPRRKNKKA